MSERKIDYDRGVHKRVNPTSGVEVYMYIDEPGVYLSAHGTPVSEDLARATGFPVDEQMKARKLKERMAEAMDKVREELSMAQRTVVKEREGFQLIDIGLGRHQILGPDGDVLTPNPLPLEQVNILFDQLVPEEKKEPAKK